MEKIKPLPDQVRVLDIEEGEQVNFAGKVYTVFSRTTLASGEPALVLGRDGEQFVIGAAKFFAESKTLVQKNE
ncbi:MAG: hypothetical protein ACREQW_10045 [Candidatus Binatia bacterium]